MFDEVKKARNLINYQEGSVVSRTLLDKKSGTVTLFAFDKHEGLSEHTAPFDALIYIIEGSIQVRISNKEYKLTEGEMIMMPANEPHSIASVEKSKMLLVMIKSNINE